MKRTRLLVLVGAVVLLFGLSTAALAQPTYPPTTQPPTSVAPTTIEPKSGGVLPNVEEPGVLGDVQGQGVGGLAFTGAELTLLVGAFGILLAGGAVVLIAARRRSRAQHA